MRVFDNVDDLREAMSELKAATGKAKISPQVLYVTREVYKDQDALDIIKSVIPDAQIKLVDTSQL